MDYLQYFGKMSVKKFKYTKVLNLIINGLPSIHLILVFLWRVCSVLNLIINGLPSIQKIILNIFFKDFVLNLIINGLPSILIIDVLVETSPYLEF